MIGKQKSTYEPNEQELQAELKNFEDFSKANNPLVRYDTNGSSIIDGLQTNERMTGYPNPKLYDQFYINKYSFPKGLTSCTKQNVDKKPRSSIYDMYA